MMDSVESTLVKPVASLVPGRLNVHVRVPVTHVRQSIMPTPNVTTFTACELPGLTRYDEFGDHVFVQNIDGPGDGYMTFIFVEDRGTAMFDPVDSLSRPLTEPHLWKTCLLQLGAIEDATQPINVEIGGSVVEIPRLFGRMHKLPGGVYATDIDMLTFVGHRPFTREEMGKLETQVTTQVYWQGRNLTVNEDCMHGLIEFEETQTSGTVRSGWGTVDNPLVPAGKTIFPPTPMTKWRRYLFDQKHELVEGEYRLVQYWANPPRGVKRILDAAT